MAAALRPVPLVPERFALRPNRPNPFHDRTRIEFDLPAPARVKLEVFDAQGRRVRTVASGSWAAGSHVVEWDRRDTRGNRVAPGVYLYRLEAGRSRAERKLVVLP
jgi:flagellar hook assembly protein FlgD